MKKVLVLVIIGIIGISLVGCDFDSVKVNGVEYTKDDITDKAVEVVGTTVEKYLTRENMEKASKFMSDAAHKILENKENREAIKKYLIGTAKLGRDSTENTYELLKTILPSVSDNADMEETLRFSKEVISGMQDKAIEGMDGVEITDEQMDQALNKLDEFFDKLPDTVDNAKDLMEYIKNK